MNDENMTVLINTIGAVESGGQVYGRRNYSAYAAPHTNSPKEYTITLGWAQNYGAEAQKLVNMIYAKDPAAFNRIDPQGKIKAMTVKGHDWVKERWNPDTYQRYILLALIDSPAGRKCQDELFAELMKQYIDDCEKEFTQSTKAVMMYCEIRHLGGKGPADRIFKRCNGNYSLDNIMAALKQDQSDTSNNNQVGDKKFWSRHQKCREFIDKYAVSEDTNNQKTEPKGNKSTMTIIIGSARIDENGRAHGGKAGDQTGREVSEQSYYKHSGGWRAFRFKNPEYARRAAYAMHGACHNRNWGYDQYQRTSGMKQVAKWGYDPSKLDKPSETDCSNLVRVCFTYATGHDPGDFDTSGEASALLGTGLVEEISFNQNTGTGLCTGDILVTCHKGHTAIVTDGAARNGSETPEARTSEKTSAKMYIFMPATIRLGSKGNSVLLFQEIYNARNTAYKWGRETLVLDGECGLKTVAAIKWYQRQRKLEADGICGMITWKDLLSLPYTSTGFAFTTIETESKGTNVLLFQEIFNSRNAAYKWGQTDLELDSENGPATKSAIIWYQRQRKLEADGICGPITAKDLIAIR